MRILVIPVVLFFVSIGLGAGGNATNTTIKTLVVNQDIENGSVLLIKTNRAKSSSIPTCHTNTAYDYSVKIDNDIGKAWLSILLTAHTTGSKISLYGSNGCYDYTGSNIETLDEIRLNP